MSYQPITISDSESSSDAEPDSKKSKCVSLFQTSLNIQENKIQMNKKIADFITDLIEKNEEIVKPTKNFPRRQSIAQPTNNGQIKPAELITELIKQNDKIVNCDKNSFRPLSIRDRTSGLQKCVKTVNSKSLKQLQIAENLVTASEEVNESIVFHSIVIEDTSQNNKFVYKDGTAGDEIEIQCEIGTELYRDMKFLPEVLNEKSIIYKEVGIQCEMGYEVLRAFYS